MALTLREPSMMITLQSTPSRRTSGEMRGKSGPSRKTSSMGDGTILPIHRALDEPDAERKEYRLTIPEG